ncbi:neuronal acetylcholine receptor subunit alpha-10-like isoform X1 [Lineus longissimus]|uniref:neuronal acetylcholine receptor subunit alpha-10-like isoform X1 n=1 Tax=Lineus longissimus TaxID=88925 RepID=UPI002B4D9C23
MGIQWFDWLLLLLACCLASFTKASPEERTLLKLLLSDGDTVARPVQHPWEVVNVTLKMWVLHVVQLEHIGNNLTIATKYRLRWNVPRLTWKPEDHGNVTSLHLQPTRIWTPDLILLNSLMKHKFKDGMSRDSLLADTPVVVTPDGRAEWRSPTITKAHCKMDPIYFPFDRNKCTMNFTLLTHTVKEVILQPDGLDALTFADEQRDEMAADFGTWHVDVEPAKQGLVSFGITSDPHSELLMTLVLDRKPLFYAYNVIYPAMIIMSVSLLGFCLPENTSEKMVFGIHILVAMNFFQQYLLKILFPTGEGIPLLGQLFGTGVVMAMIIVVCGVLTLRIHFKGAREPGNLPNPTVIKVLARLTSMQSYVDDLISSEPVLVRRIPRTDYEEQNVYAMRNTNFRTSSLGTDARFQDGNACRNRLRSVSQRQCTWNSLHSIVSEVSDLRQIYQSQSKAENVAEETKTAWELIARMLRRFTAVACAVAFVAACTGIYLQLKFRPED